VNRMASADVLNTTVKSRYFIVRPNESRLEPVILSKKVNLRLDYDAVGNLIGAQWRKEGKEWN
jgi:hypothetical protein